MMRTQDFDEEKQIAANRVVTATQKTLVTLNSQNTKAEGVNINLGLVKNTEILFSTINKDAHDAIFNTYDN